MSGGRSGRQYRGRAGGEHRESGCEAYTDSVHYLEAGGKWVVDSDEPRGTGRGRTAGDGELGMRV